MFLAPKFLSPRALLAASLASSLALTLGAAPSRAQNLAPTEKTDLAGKTAQPASQAETSATRPDSSAAKAEPTAESAPAAAAAAPQAPLTPAPAPTTAASPTPAAPPPAPAADPAASSSAAAAVQAVDDAIKQEELAPRSILESHGEASWEEGYAKITEAIAKLRAAAEKAGLKINGRPMAIFTDAQDQSFKFDAALPVEAAADAKPTLDSKDISFVQSPGGKALRFEHRGPYDDIDTTYEAITAYMDEKGFDAKNLFIEEYLNDPKDSGDGDAQVDIHVFLK